ncbi:hypothetical protein KIN20_018502 [Parelaphostrongylus tenuis]|uniref:Uncharacterized protein n=1 Tax=Parelaphostrongylus tenuis TaxID=148309 RepID=A0AAD5MPY6_PARTN|nr:hypothetical protein KIN20_018502 [Parelaphostrongylus tenuis]
MYCRSNRIYLAADAASLCVTEVIFWQESTCEREQTSMPHSVQRPQGRHYFLTRRYVVTRLLVALILVKASSLFCECVPGCVNETIKGPLLSTRIRRNDNDVMEGPAHSFNHSIQALPKSPVFWEESVEDQETYRM